MQIFFEDAEGNMHEFAEFKDQILLIVNVASFCDHTHQYSQLVELKKRFINRPFEILAFPCNQFNNQEPNNINEIKKFCQINYNINFPIFNKIEVKGDNIHPLYKFLLDNTPCNFKINDVKWNFTKFLINVDMRPIKRYNPSENPIEFYCEIEEYVLLAENRKTNIE